MTITCPSCGYEFDINVDNFKKILHDHPGFVDIFFEEILKNTAWFDRAAEMVENEKKEKRKAENKSRKLAKKAAKAKIENMTPDEHVEYLNMDYNSLPDDLKPFRTKHVQKFKFIQMNNPNIGEQKECCPSRIYKNYIDSGMDADAYRETLNIYGKNYGVTIEERDFDNYIYYGISPKIDKQTVMSKATGMPISYFGGYGPDDIIPKNEVLAAMVEQNRRRWKSSKKGA